MPRSPRIVAAALAGPVVLALAAVALAPEAGGRASAPVVLQVAPRGLGSVSSQPPGRNSDGEIVTVEGNYAGHVTRVGPFSPADPVGEAAPVYGYAQPPAAKSAGGA